LMITLVLALAVAAPIQQVKWSGRSDLPGVVVPARPDQPFESLVLVNEADTARTFTVAVLEHPKVTEPRWVIRGRVRYANASGHGYWEMWNGLSKGGMYFSRTLGVSGPMQWLSGTSVWRGFALPFDASAAPDVPERLIVNVVLPGRGRVELSALELYQGTLAP